MGNSSIVVEVWDAERKVRQEYVFEKAPVRLGRSPLNDLPLERPFVSHCHGVLHAEGSGCVFVDLGSTNGSFLRDVRLPKNQPTLLSPADRLQIGTLELRVRTGPSGEPRTQTSYAFQPSRLSLARRAEPTAAIDGPSTARGRASDASRDVLAVRVASLIGLPGVGHDPEFPERLAIVLERFAQAFLELRQGQRQLTREAALPALDGVFEGVESARGLLAHLLEPGSPAGRVDELSRAYADLMLHQVALLNGFTAGARELLEELSPRSLAQQAGALGALLRWVGVDGRWSSLRRRYEDLAEDSALSKVLMGRAFARAYAAVMGRTAAAHTGAPRDTGPV